MAFIWKKAEFVSLYNVYSCSSSYVLLALFSLFLIAHTLYPTVFGALDQVTPYFSMHR